MTGVRFGFLQEPTQLSFSAGCIEPLNDHVSIVAKLLGHERAYAGWRYPPLKAVRPDAREEKTPPEVFVSFALPATHRLVMGEAHPSDDAANFFIALFGMLKGLRLQRDTWQHFYRCPLQPGTLCDFFATDREIIEALDVGAAFWTGLPDDAERQLAFGAIHWHLFAQLYDHEFERFNAQYMVLDTCWKLATRMHPRLKKGNPSHPKRVQVLGHELEISLPEWAALVDDSKTSILSSRRNALIHEAMYGDQPVGFAYPDDGSVERELTCFVGRLLLRLIGVDNEYTRSPSTTRQTFGFSFPSKAR